MERLCIWGFLSFTVIRKRVVGKSKIPIKDILSRRITGKICLHFRLHTQPQPQSKIKRWKKILPILRFYLTIWPARLILDIWKLRSCVEFMVELCQKIYLLKSKFMKNSSDFTLRELWGVSERSRGADPATQALSSSQAILLISKIFGRGEFFLGENFIWVGSPVTEAFSSPEDILLSATRPDSTVFHKHRTRRLSGTFRWILWRWNWVLQIIL